jgi:hypothetical protein
VQAEPLQHSLGDNNEPATRGPQITGTTLRHRPTLERGPPAGTKGGQCSVQQGRTDAPTAKVRVHGDLGGAEIPVGKGNLGMPDKLTVHKGRPVQLRPEGGRRVAQQSDRGVVVAQRLVGPVLLTGREEREPAAQIVPMDIEHPYVHAAP